jgi:hypothetical protein
MRVGIFPAKAVKDAIQFGETNNGTLQMAVVMRTVDEPQESTTFLFFSPEAAPYSFDRLRSLGWKGADLNDLTGIDTNAVATRYWVEEYQGKPQNKCEIMGGSRVTLSKPMDQKSFAARVAALTGQPVGGTQKSAGVPWEK